MDFFPQITADTSASGNGGSGFTLFNQLLTGMKGSWTGLWVEVGAGTSLASSNKPSNIVGGTFDARGTSDAPAVGSPINGVWAQGNYTYVQGHGWNQMIGIENDFSCSSNCDVNYFAGLSVVLLNGHTTAALTENAGYAITAGLTAAHTIDTAFEVGGYQGHNPIQPNGWILAYRRHANNDSGEPAIMGGFLDFSGVSSCNINQYQGPGNNFVIGCLGGLQLAKQINYGTGSGTTPANTLIYDGNTATAGACNDAIRCSIMSYVFSEGADISAAPQGSSLISYADNLTSTFKGNHTGNLFIFSVGQTPVTSAIATYVGGQYDMRGNATAGGTTTNMLAQDNLVSVTAAGWTNLVGTENDMNCSSACNLLYMNGNAVVLQASNAVAASRENIGYAVTMVNGGTPTIDTAYAIGNYLGNNPISTTGWVMRYLKHLGIGAGPTITGGIDFTAFTFTGNAFQSSGASIDGAGNITGRLVATSGFTVATLPTAGTAGRRAFVTDQTTSCPSAGAALTGGGTVKCPVFDNGTAWVGD